MNKIREVLLLNHLDNQAGSCTAGKWDSASGLDGFATTTAILFNCITLAAAVVLHSAPADMNREEAPVFGRGLILCFAVWR